MRAEKVVSDQAGVENAEARVGQLQRRRDDLRAVKEALARRTDVSKRVAALTAELDRQYLIRADIDARLAPAEGEMSRARADVSECQRAVRANQAEITKLQELVDDLPQFAEDTALAADMARRIADAQQRLRDAEVRCTQAAKEVQAARQARELREPEYRRAVAEQAERERLLDELRSHVQGDLCPLCGSKFQSAELLLTSMRSQRESQSSNVDVTAVYPVLVFDETKAQDGLRAASATASVAKAAVEELTTIQGATDQRVRDFYGRLTAAVVTNGADANEVRELLPRRDATLRERLSASASRAEAARRKLETLETSQVEESARRHDVQERVAALDGEVQRLAERAKSWTAQVERVLPESDDVQSTLTTESASVEKAIVGLSAALEQMQATRERNSKAVQVLGVRKRELSQRRSVLVARLNAVNGLLSTFRQKLRGLGVSNDGDVESLERVIREETRHSDTIGALAGRSVVVLGALRAREQRRRLAEARQRLQALSAEIQNWEEQIERIKGATAACVAIESLLKQERQGSIERHIAAYGPMITMIQRRLRAVYGFGGVQLEARGRRGEGAGRVAEQERPSASHRLFQRLTEADLDAEYLHCERPTAKLVGLCACSARRSCHPFRRPECVRVCRAPSRARCHVVQ